jgi:hypothetical protein
MGLLDSLFADKPSQKSIDKLILKVKERYAQPEYRREAMDKLLSWGTPEALAAVLMRFTVVVQSPHWDEEEKRWLVDELATRGEPAKQALQAFLGRDDHVAFASKALRRLSPSADAWIADLVTALKARPPEDHRTTQGKAELINQLRDAEAKGVVAVLLPYLTDHADDVQMACLDAIEKLYGEASDEDKAAAGDVLKAVVADDARSARVLRQAATVMATLKLAVDPTRPLAPAVAEDFVVKDGALVSSR